MYHGFDLTGKHALISGGSKGIGLATARIMAELGADVTLVARDEVALKHATASIPRAKYLVADVSHKEEIDALVDTAGKVDIVVANAGGPRRASPLQQTEEDWQTGFDLTLMSTVRLARAFLPQMMEQRWGRIIAITSLTVTRPVLSLATSNALRAGVENYLRTLALEVAPYHITANMVAPGYTLTDRLKEVLNTPEAQENMANTIPAKRLGTAEEVASAIAYLASPIAGYVTGQSILVDGGYCI